MHITYEPSPHQELEGRVDRYLRKWSCPLGIDHWTLRVRFAEVDQQRRAEISPNTRVNQALLDISDDQHLFSGELGDYELELTIVHELLHLTQGGFLDVISLLEHSDFFPAAMHPMVDDIIEAAAEHQVEILSRALVKR